MSSQGKRVGNFSWITPTVVMGLLVTIAILVVTGRCWSASLADPESVPWLVTYSVTAAAIPASICCMYWTASRFILWIAVGEELTFATMLGSQTLSWDDVQGIEFEVEYKTVPLVVLPLALVVGQHCIAVITLANGRMLRGRINHDEAMIFHGLLGQYPKLDLQFTRALSSPRATMTTFVDAVMEDNFVYASKFLNLSQFDERTAIRIAAPCASKLKEVIDRIWYIDYEEIPDDPEFPSPYTLASSSDQDIDEDLMPIVQAIKISRDRSSGFWRFDSETVGMIVNEFIELTEADDASH